MATRKRRRGKSSAAVKSPTPRTRSRKKTTAAKPPVKEADATEGQFTCGKCRWYILPKKQGQTCRTLEGVSETTASCKSFASRPKGVRSITELKRDPFVLKLVETLKSKKLRVDPALLREVKGYLIFRKEVKDRIERPVPDRIATRKELLLLEGFYEECQSYRDRVAEIRMSVTPIYRKLKKMRLYAEAWCYEQPVITEVLKTVDQRKAVIALILKPLTDRMTLVESVRNVCELCESNLSNAHFTLKEIKEVTTTFLQKQHTT